MQDIKYYTQANREAWNEVMPRHRAAAGEKLDKLFSQPGFIIQTHKPLLDLFQQTGIGGKDIVHLCCNNGSELLSLKNMGAGRCLGIDISEQAVEEARQRARLCSIDCQFLCSDVYDIPGDLHNSFDMVHITPGCLGWIPDITLFFAIAAKLLRQEGSILIDEIHPFSEMLPFDSATAANPLEIREPYFEEGPVVENSSLDYIGGTDYNARTQYWFKHTISDIFTALIENGFSLTRFSEHTVDRSCGHRKQEKLQAGLPLSMLIAARKLQHGGNS